MHFIKLKQLLGKDQFVLMHRGHRNLFFYVHFYPSVAWLIGCFHLFSSKNFLRKVNEKEAYIKVTKL